LHRRTLSKCWKVAEGIAALPELKGRGLHSLRRKFATEMKDMPLRDLAHLSGWKCTNTVVMVYQQADDATMRAALSKRMVLKSVANSK
jgi:integrase